ncbi:MAG: molybdopterin biosynthesis protein MoeB [Flavobacteriaceae bacterium]|nr:molybdopterin biosynthesis protein MoeB [Flavobacteriaceae bacterium]
MKNITKEELYRRQTTLHEIGDEGQQKLLQTKVLVVGCGGLGNAAAVYLAASGIGEIHLVDFDKISKSNLHRQVFFTTEDVGKSKVEVLANHIKSISPFTIVKTNERAITKNNVLETITNVDYVLDCTDSLPIKYLLNDVCVLNDKPLIYGSLYKFDGYVSSFNVKNSEGAFGTNLRDAFPEMSEQKVPNCSEVGTLNTIVGIIGLMQANEVLKLVTGVGIPLMNELLIYNSLDNSQYKMKLTKSVSKEQIVKIFHKEAYFDPSCQIQDDALLITADTLKHKLSSQENSKDLNIISVIEDTHASFPFAVNDKVPLSKLVVEKLDLSDQKEHIIICNRGISSYAATKKIKEKYPKLNVLSLEGGITNY